MPIRGWTLIIISKLLNQFQMAKTKGKSIFVQIKLFIIIFNELFKYVQQMV